MAWLLLGALALSPAAALAADGQPSSTNQAGEDMNAYVEGASRLEGRIMAPCCWMQTIDIHGSPIAEELRSEIRKRLRAGESPDAIEASFVQRYGEKILAVPNSSPIGGLATFLALGFGGAGVSAYFMLKRWSRARKVALIESVNAGWLDLSPNICHPERSEGSAAGVPGTVE